VVLLGFFPVINNLIKGKTPFDSSYYRNQNSSMLRVNNANYSEFHLETGKTHQLRLVNASAGGNQKLSINNHNLIVIANDFILVQSYTTKVVTLRLG
jgi:FtsP/CotA-like multicopper oxidase with cupredoxin domain